MKTTRTNETSSYWKSVQSCLARPDGSAEIRHHDGRVETFKSGGEERKKTEEKGGRRRHGETLGLGA